MLFTFRSKLLKTVCLVFGGVIYSFTLLSQELPNIILPSPEATAFQRMGMENYDTYTGAASVSIPLANIQVGDISVPISLNYIGSHGIKVEEIASRVGLGWSLGGSGMISRIVRSLPDEQINNGWLDRVDIPPIISLEYIDEIEDIALGEVDGEADLYHYNAPGISGSFMMKKNGDIFQIPLTDNEIVPSERSISTETYGVYTNHWNEFQYFDIITPQGLTYRFAKKEVMMSITYGTITTNPKFLISTWHLTEISDYNGVNKVYFEYDWEQEDYNDPSIYFSESPEKNKALLRDVFPGQKYTKTQVVKPVLSRVYDNQGVNDITFNSGIERCDRPNTYTLDSVVVEKYGTRVQKHVFDYSYFNKSGITELPTTCTTRSNFDGTVDGDMYMRLKLDGLTTYGKTDSVYQTHTFEYYTDELLPDRYSYARDHWGYYNGQDNNLTLFPKQYLEFEGFVGINEGEHTYQIVGSANRSISTSHAKAGMLTRINYPTGGYTTFTYESNQASSTGIPGELEEAYEDIADESTEQITIELVDMPFVDVQLRVNVDFEVSQFCDVYVTFEHTSEDYDETVRFWGSEYNTSTAYINKVLLIPGTYDVTVTKVDKIGDCFNEDDYYPVSLSWVNEKESNLVGGLRLAEINNCASPGDCVTTAFEYKTSSGNSSGYLAVIPQYGMAVLDSYIREDSTGSADTIIYTLDWNKTYSSNQPLLETSGNVVGYDRVVQEMTSNDNTNGYVVHEYISPNDIKELEFGYSYEKYDDWITFETLGKSKSYRTWPVVPLNPRDWARGKPLTVSTFNSSGSMIQKLSYSYKLIIDTKTSLPSSNFSLLDIISPSVYTSESNLEYDVFMTGLKTEGLAGTDSNPIAYAKLYEMSTGKIQQTEVEKVEFDLESTRYQVVSETSFEELTDFVRSSSVEDSKGKEHQNNYWYSFDESIPGMSTSEMAVVNELSDSNHVKIPIRSESVVGEELEHVGLSIYNDFSSSVYLSEVKESYGSTDLFSKGTINEYDIDGQPLSITTRDGLTKIYTWWNYGLVNAVSTGPDSELVYFDYELNGNNSAQSWSGEKSLVTDGSVTYNLALTGSGLVYSYWYFDGTNWQFSGYLDYASTITITKSIIDDFRVHHKSAMVNTLSYNSYGEVISKSDASGIPTHFSYDGLGRLTNITDHKGNIIEHYEYHLTGPNSTSK